MYVFSNLKHKQMNHSKCLSLVTILTNLIWHNIGMYNKITEWFLFNLRFELYFNLMARTGFHTHKERKKTITKEGTYIVSSSSRNLRSSGTGMLTPRRVKCSFGEKAFATSAPVLWNALPSNVRNAKSVESFKSGLKTYLFSSYFD